MAQLKDYLDEKQLEQANRLINFAKHHNKAYVLMGAQINDPSHPRIIITVYNQEKRPDRWERSTHATWYFYLRAKVHDREDFGNTFGSGFGPNATKEFKNFERFFNSIPKLFWIKKDENTQIASELLKIAKECITEKETEK